MKCEIVPVCISRVRWKRSRELRIKHLEKVSHVCIQLLFPHLSESVMVKRVLTVKQKTLPHQPHILLIVLF